MTNRNMNVTVKLDRKPDFDTFAAEYPADPGRQATEKKNKAGNRGGRP